VPAAPVVGHIAVVSGAVWDALPGGKPLPVRLPLSPDPRLTPVGHVLFSNGRLVGAVRGENAITLTLHRD
jgi:hypothetical protein